MFLVFFAFWCLLAVYYLFPNIKGYLLLFGSIFPMIMGLIESAKFVSDEYFEDFSTVLKVLLFIIVISSSTLILSLFLSFSFVIILLAVMIMSYSTFPVITSIIAMMQEKWDLSDEMRILQEAFIDVKNDAKMAEKRALELENLYQESIAAPKKERDDYNAELERLSCLLSNEEADKKILKKKNSELQRKIKLLKQKENESFDNNLKENEELKNKIDQLVSEFENNKNIISLKEKEEESLKESISDYQNKVDELSNKLEILNKENEKNKGDIRFANFMSIFIKIEKILKVNIDDDVSVSCAIDKAHKDGWLPLDLRDELHEIRQKRNGVVHNGDSVSIRDVERIKDVLNSLIYAKQNW